MTGRIHSLQSLGAVDGPGMRYVVFMQGCPLRCAYCHNPDTWDYCGGEEMSAEKLVKKILRIRPYLKNGGVTVSGGEPLSQAPFVTELFKLLHDENIHTALDTSGVCQIDEAKALLEHTDLVLADLKFSDEIQYKEHCGGNLKQVEKFLTLTEEMNVPLWIRHVVIPNLTDSLENLRNIKQKAESYKNLERIEWLPFHKLCENKYKLMGIDFPLSNTSEMKQEELDKLIEHL